MTGYHRLTREERYQIEALLNSGLSLRQMAQQLNRAPSTLSRELAKSKANQTYSAGFADNRSQEQRRKPRYSLRKIRGELETYIREKILLDWSPEQIVGRRRQLRMSPSICYQSIYRYIERDKKRWGSLWSHLRVLRKKRKDRKSPHWRPFTAGLPPRTMIEERPKIVEARRRLGDYERDTLLGKAHRSLLLTIVDRTSRLLKLAWLPKSTSHFVHEATVGLLKKETVKTITNDNGHEFARHPETARALKAAIYFSHSYRAWERGTNENTNGLLRQYFPRKKDIAQPPAKELRRIEYLLNTRPRKCLGFKTPLEIHQKLKSSVLR